MKKKYLTKLIDYLEVDLETERNNGKHWEEMYRTTSFRLSEAQDELDKLETVAEKYQTDSSYEKVANDQAEYIRKLQLELDQLKGSGTVFANDQLQEGMRELKEKQCRAVNAIRDCMAGGRETDFKQAGCQALEILTG